MNSYDIVESVTDEATKQFLGMRESQARKDFLRDVCKDIDTLIERTEASSLSVNIDENTMDVDLCVSCLEIVVEERNHPLHQVLVNAKSFAVQKSQDAEDEVELRFRFPGIWVAE